MAALLDGDGLPPVSAPRRGPSITLVRAPRARLRLREPRRPGAVRGRPRPGAGDARHGARGVPRPRARRRRRGARDDRRGAGAADSLLANEDGVRPAIDLVYRSIVRAATELPDRAEPRRRGAQRRRAAHSPCSRRARSRRPSRSPSTPRDLIGLLAQEPARDQMRRRARHGPRQLEQQPRAAGWRRRPHRRAIAVAGPPSDGSRPRGSAGRLDCGSRGSGCSRASGHGSARCAGRGWRTSSSTPLARAFSAAAATLSRSWSSAEHRREAQLRAAAIASTPDPMPTSSSGHGALLARGELEQQLQAQARGRVRAGAERLPGVDHDLGDAPHAGAARAPTAAARAARARAARERGARSGAARCGSLDQHRPVEALPALVPVVGHLARRDLDQRVPGRGAQCRQLGQLARCAVDGVLDVSARRSATSSTPAGHELQQLGQHQLGVLARTRTASRITPPGCRARDAASRTSTPASAGSRSVSVLVQALEQLALLVAEPARDDDVDDDAQVAPPAGRGPARACPGRAA